MNTYRKIENKNHYYKIAVNDFVVSADDGLRDYLGIIRDTWEDFDESDMEEYFDKINTIFLSKFKTVINLKRKMTPEEEKELKFMFETLLHAHSILRGRKKK